MISVIIPVFNGEPWLAEQLAALADQKFDDTWELLVVDNGSTDSSVETATEWASELPMRQLLCSERGVNAARNLGAREARFDKLAFLDQDDVADRGWLAAMNRALDTHALVGGRLEYEQINSSDALAGRDHKLATSILPKYRGAPHAIGCNMGCRRAVFDELDGLDASLLPGADEMDFFFRAHRAGIDATFVPEAVVSYRLRGTRRDYRRQMHTYAISHAQLDAKLRGLGLIPKQSNRSRAAAVVGHAKGLADVRLWFSRVGRFRYAQRLGNATGAAVGFVRYRQLVV